ncbi:hypothetical protein BGX26_001427, partial [Mortierella sp. AD094]
RKSSCQLHIVEVKKLKLPVNTTQGGTYMESSQYTAAFANDLKPLEVFVNAYIMFPQGSSSYVDVTEGDLPGEVWLHLLSQLFLHRRKEVGARVKFGKSTRVASIYKRGYSSDPPAITFKIDMSIILNHPHKGEIDFVAVEVARSPRSSKIFPDGARLLCGCEENLDGIACTFRDNEDFPDNENFLERITCYGIQIMNFATIISVHLVAPKLHVAVPEVSFELPELVGSTVKLENALNALFWFRGVAQERSILTEGALVQERSLNVIYGHVLAEAQPLGRKSWVGSTPPTRKSVQTLL